jgi:hypothetical protein
MLDSGPCHACPLATGILATPTGVHRTCKPEHWQLCNLLYCASKAETEPETRRSRVYRGRNLVRKTRTVAQLFARS